MGSINNPILQDLTPSAPLPAMGRHPEVLRDALLGACQGGLQASEPGTQADEAYGT